MEVKEKLFNLITPQIPVISTNEIKVIEEKDYVSIFYGINSIDQNKEAVDLILKEGLKYEGVLYNPSDFKIGVKFSNKIWYVENGINIYENIDTNESNSILKENKESFEKVYWLIKVKK
tara:strand:+ start:11 stop:367 length:357 start_codon:yes stop_codon:yes gene_type:complete